MRDEPIGLIGVGLLGSALAERLIGDGLSVLGYDIDPERHKALKALGGHAAGSAGEVARSCRRILLSLPSSDVVTQVLDALLPELERDSLIIDTTTGEPTATAAFGRRLAEGQLRYLDATIAGSSHEVRNKKGIVMAGGTASDVEAASDLLSAFAHTVFHVGPCGSGARMKLVVNLVLGLNRAVLAEGLAFARASGLDLSLVVRILKASPAYSHVMDTKGDKMLAGDFSAQARLAQHHKDVRLILAEGRQAGAHLPFSREHEKLLRLLVERGLGDLDNSAVILAFDEDVDPEPPSLRENDA